MTFIEGNEIYPDLEKIARHKIQVANWLNKLSNEALEGVDPLQRGAILLETFPDLAALSQEQKNQFYSMLEPMHIAYSGVRFIVENFGLENGQIKDKILAYETLYGERPKNERFLIVPRGIGFNVLLDREDASGPPHNISDHHAAHLRGSNKQLLNTDVAMDKRFNDIIIETKRIPQLPLDMYGPIIESDFLESSDFFSPVLTAIYYGVPHENKHLIDRLWNYQNDMRHRHFRRETSAVLYELGVMETIYNQTRIPALLVRAKKIMQYAIDNDGQLAKAMFGLLQRYGQPQLWSFLLTIDSVNEVAYHFAQASGQFPNNDVLDY